MRDPDLGNGRAAAHLHRHSASLHEPSRVHISREEEDEADDPTGTAMGYGGQTSNGNTHEYVNGHTEQYLRPRPGPPSHQNSHQKDTAQPRLVPLEETIEANVRQRPTAALLRTKSDFGPSRRSVPQFQQDQESSTNKSREEEQQQQASQIRHGWDNEYSSSEYLSFLHSNFYIYFTDKRHENNGRQSIEAAKFPSKDWRMKDRMKTVSAAICICLNIGVDPPDVIKTNPTAVLEAWVNPNNNNAGNKAMEQIGKRLQEQYESLSLRTRYKQYLDPSVEETKKFAISMRKNARDERVLLHYNGHGVPLPTASGELWVFNKNYTQYIPVGIYDLQSWLAGPSLFVYDVSHAGNILHNFEVFLKRHEKENEDIRARDPAAQIPNYGDCIQLAACERNEMLPTNPDLPADLFTCCLTTPIDIALRWFVLQNPLDCPVKLDDSKIPVPGRLQDRRSPLGELNWIFTAITDTIAWNVLPRPLFKKLFRQDLMVAALFRNFLLAERIMRANNCHPISSPALPETHHHPLWQSWDLALEMVIRQMPMLREMEEGKLHYDYQHSTFFTEQLTAFEVYLASGPTEDHAPDQLPIVLQVLLSQVHRLRALILLSKFLDLGPWAVHLALSIGIFPYVVKLLQAASLELKPVMVFIWARIMAVDFTVQTDLLKDNGIQYFIAIVNPQSDIPVGNASEHRAMCAFIVATFCKNYPQGQTVCNVPDLIQSCMTNMGEPENPLLRQWSCLCLSMLWHNYPEAIWQGVRNHAHLRLTELSLDPVPEVRAAMLHALNNFMGIPDVTEAVQQNEEFIAQAVLFMASDGSTLVRKELVIFLSTFVARYENKFIVAAYEAMLDERDRQPNTGAFADGDSVTSSKLQAASLNTTFGSVWAHVLILSVDPHAEIAQGASVIVDHVHESLVNSPAGGMAVRVIRDLQRAATLQAPTMRKIPSVESVKSLIPQPTTPEPQMKKSESYLSLSIKRTASSLRNFAFGTPVISETDDEKHESSPQKPQTPIQPTNTPRGRLPPQWSQPPDSANSSTKHASGKYHTAVTPLTSGLSGLNEQDSTTPSTRTSMTLARKSIPLESTLLEWSTEYFREPQMRANDPDEPGSLDYNTRLWRRTRNERIIADNQPLKPLAGSKLWTRCEGVINNGSQPLKMVFHQFDSHLAVTDDKDTVSVFDFARGDQISRFSNGNPVGSRINGATFLNEDDLPLLMVGSSDGVLKVYRNYADPKEVKTVTAWRALTELVPSNKNAGLVFDWQQGQGKVLVAGDVKVIKVWNAATETVVAEIPARSNSCITSLTSDQLAGQVFVAGYGDGVVRQFDQRLDRRTCMVKVWREHQQWITNVHMQRGGTRELISGSRNGIVKLWDLRSSHSVSTLHVTGNHDIDGATTTATMRSLSVHEHAPVFAVGDDSHHVKTFNTSGKALGAFDLLTNANWRGAASSVASLGGVGVSARKNAVVATAYHPHKMLLACAGWGDNHVSLIGY